MRQFLSIASAAFALAVSTVPAYAENSTGPKITPGGPVVLPGAEQFTIESRITGRTYVISVAKPRIPDPIFSLYKLTPPTRFAAVYAPDADVGFLFSAQLAQTLQGGEDVQPFYTIGIGYGTTDYMKFLMMRQKDLTPTVDPKAPPFSAAWGMGGAEQFLQFIERELKPEIARRYPVDPARTTITGLSHAGLFALWALFTHPDAFQGYLALDPANWDDYVGERIEAAFAKAPRSLEGKRLYVGLESPEYSDAALRAATGGIRDRWLKFCATVEGRKYPGLAFKCEAHRNESHFSVSAPGSTQGLRWIYPVNASLPASTVLPSPTK